MRIVIPTRGRAFQQTTLCNLPSQLLEKVDIVCPQSEVEPFGLQWGNLIAVHAQPDDITTIAKKRQWIIEKWIIDDDKIFFMDDDLRFFIKTPEDPRYLVRASGPEVFDIMGQIEEKLSEEFPMVSLGVRQGNNRKDPGWEIPGKITLTMGMHLPTILKECELGRINTREDYDYTLQILRKGYKNAVYNTICVNQSGYGTRGGCTGERTVASSNADAHKLAELHPGFVRVVERNYKNVPRSEVICYWKKALEAGKKWRDSQTGGSKARE